MVSEKIMLGRDSEYPLNGLLTLPDDQTEPVPAVVMVHGSGPSNMDEKVMKLTPFRDLADGLAKQGIASVRYDKRTQYRLEEVVLRQLRQAGGSNSFLKRIVSVEYRIFAKKFENLYQMRDDEAKKKRFAGNLSLYYFKEMGQKTAADYLLESRKPVLILQGGMDFQVQAEDDFAQFRKILADRADTEFKLYPGLNHLFVEGIYGDILKASKEYSVERHIGENVIGDIAAFILA